MRTVDVLQGSDEWDELRRGVPTASNFGKIITAVKAQLSTSWQTYAVELLAAELKVVVPPPPSFWMEWGTENEPYAVAAYELMTGRKTEQVGFVWPDDHKRYGCSPDRLVGDDGLLECKCPMPETVLKYHLTGFPNDYKPQVQGQLLVTGREWCDFLAYHPELKPFLVRVERDEKYIANLTVALDEFCENLEELRSKLAGVNQAVDVSITDDYQPVNYESTGTI
jgi:predicted phage-related endonuclease